MGLFTTKSCFFCLSVRTGGLALGALVLLQGIVGVVEETYSHVSFSQMARRHGFYGNVPPVDRMMFAASIVLLQVISFVSIVWLYGIYKKKASWMMAFVIYHFITLLALIGLLLVLVASFFIILPHPFYFSSYADTWVHLAVVLLLIVLQWHLSAVVYSLYKNVKAESNRKPETLYPVIGNKV